MATPSKKESNFQMNLKRFEGMSADKIISTLIQENQGPILASTSGNLLVTLGLIQKKGLKYFIIHSTYFEFDTETQIGTERIKLKQLQIKQPSKNEAFEAAEVSNAVKVSDVAEVSDATEVPNVAEVSNATEVPNVAEVSNATVDEDASKIIKKMNMLICKLIPGNEPILASFVGIQFARRGLKKYGFKLQGLFSEGLLPGFEYVYVTGNTGTNYIQRIKF
jgi:hypothetical protein